MSIHMCWQKFNFAILVQKWVFVMNFGRTIPRTIVIPFGCSEKFRVNRLCDYVNNKHLYVIQDVLSQMCWQKFGFCIEVVFLRYRIFTNFEILSTTVHRGSIIQKEIVFIVNKIEKFNVSWFRNTQTHCQRTCERSERSNWRGMQIHDFRTIWLKTHTSNNIYVFLSTKIC